LNENEQIVISAQFMLDSESRLSEAIQKMLEVQKQGTPSTDTKPMKMKDDDPDMSKSKMKDMVETSKKHNP
jgi:hypothetical protein